MKTNDNIRLGVVSYDHIPYDGGQGRHIYEIYHQGLNKHDEFEVIYINPRKNNIPNNHTLYNFVNKIGKNISFTILINPLFVFIPKIFKLDLLNIHTGPGGLFLFFKPRITVVVTAHHTYYQQSNLVNGESWKKIFIPFEHRTYELADKIIAVSESTKKVLMTKYDVPESKLTVIPNGVNLAQFRKRNEVKAIKNSVLYVGRLDDRKGIKWMMRLFLHSAKRNKDGIKLFIGGKGKLEDWLRQFIVKNDLSSEVTLLGFIPDNELNEWFNKVDALIVPSVFEGFGLIAVEAIASNTPVLCREVDGLRDIVKNGENGYFINQDSDMHDMLSKCSKLTNVSNTVQQYSYEHVVKMTKDFYQTVMSSK